MDESKQADAGGIIRSLRMERGLKSGDLARAIGVSRSYISRIENENRRLSTPIILRIAEALSVDPSVIMGAARRDGKDLRIEKSVELLLATRGLNPAFAENLFDFLSGDSGWPREVEAWGREAVECADSLRMSLSAAVGSRDEGGAPGGPEGEWDRARKVEWVRNHLVEFIGQLEFLEAVLDEAAFGPAAASGRPHAAGHVRGLGLEVPLVKAGPDLSRPGDLPKLDAFGEAASERLFALEIEDGSMFPLYEPGTAVIFSADRVARPGDRVVACLAAGKAVCRVLRKRGEWVQLVSLNPVVDPLFLREDEIVWMHPVIRSIGR